MSKNPSTVVTNPKNTSDQNAATIIPTTINNMPQPYRIIHKDTMKV